MEATHGAAAAKGLTFRPMVDADLPFLEALYASTRAAEMAATGWPDEARRLFVQSQFRLQHSHYQRHYEGATWSIIEWRGVAIGRLYLHETPGQIHVIDIALLPDRQRAGFGTAIMADLIDGARRSSKRLTLHVEKHGRALPLYERLGFVELEDRGMHCLMEWSAQALS